jgi:hypothetical protein
LPKNTKAKANALFKKSFELIKLLLMTAKEKEFVQGRENRKQQSFNNFPPRQKTFFVLDSSAREKTETEISLRVDIY